MRSLFNQVVEDGDSYQLVFGYTANVGRFNYGFVHGSKTKIGNLFVGWNEASQTIVTVPTVPDLSGCGDAVIYRRPEILKVHFLKCTVLLKDGSQCDGVHTVHWSPKISIYVK